MTLVNTKSWVPREGPIATWRGRGTLSLARGKLTLFMFLAIVTVLFLLTTTAYVVRMRVADWQPMPEPRLLWLNTVALILSSTAMQWAKVAAGQDKKDRILAGLLAGGLFAWVFLAGQLWVWHELRQMGYFLASNPANSFFYMITALHGLHLLGGLGAWTRTTVRVFRCPDLRHVQSSVELCAIYWHFLLMVWLVMFSLLLLT